VDVPDAPQDLEPLSDDELAALALAADPEAPIPADAVPWSPYGDEPLGGTGLADWYMPPTGLGVGAAPGWRRRTAVLVIIAIGLINAAGLCITYGTVTFG
jgi:hypothetical protein